MMAEKLNLDELSGDELVKIIFDSKEGNPGIVKEIVQEIENGAIEGGGWNAQDVVSKIPVISATGEVYPKFRIRTPKKQPFPKIEIAIDAMSYELLIRTAQGWKGTGQIIKTRKIEKEKEV